MDRKLLDSFNNLSKALEELNISLNDSKKEKDTTNSSIINALKSLDITEHLKSINQSIKETQKDTKNIIKSQTNQLKSINDGIKQTNESIRQIQDIKNDINNQSDQLKSINDSIDKSYESIDVIKSQINQIKSINDNISKSYENISKINNQSDQLKSINNNIIKNSESLEQILNNKNTGTDVINKLKSINDIIGESQKNINQSQIDLNNLIKNQSDQLKSIGDSIKQYQLSIKNDINNQSDQLKSIGNSIDKSQEDITNSINLQTDQLKSINNDIKKSYDSIIQSRNNIDDVIKSVMDSQLDQLKSINNGVKQIQEDIKIKNIDNQIDILKSISGNIIQIQDELKNIKSTKDQLDQFKSINDNIKQTQDDLKIVNDQSDQLKSISDGIKQIQEELKNISVFKGSTASIQKEKKKEPESNQFTKAGDIKQKTSIKDGVGMILLIAGGVLAIGLAFKIIGNVDFKSVLALGIAIPLIAIAFEKVAKTKTTIKDIAIANLGLVMMSAAIVASSVILQYVRIVSPLQLFTTILIAGAFGALAYGISKLAIGIKNINPKDLWKLPLVLVSASAAIAASSYILQYVRPVGILQLLTSVLIAGAFSVLSFGIHKLVSGIKDVSVKDVWKLPLVLISASAAIAASSYILQYVKPVGILQLFTAILIAGAFTILSFGIGKLASSMKDVPIKDLWKLPLVLISASVAIAASSQILQFVKPVGILQLFTAVLISGVFVVLSFGLGRLASAVGDISIKKAAMLPVILVELALAITMSSFILSRVTIIPIETLINIAEQSILLSVIGISLGFTVYLMDKMGLSIGMIAKGATSLIMLSGAIMASSLILSMGSYGVYPSLTWTLDVGITMLAFGALAAISGEFIETIIPGTVGLLLIAGTIMASSLIISIGSYQKYPDLKWTTSVSISMLAFGIGMVSIGSLVLGTGGLGMAGIVLGGVGILLIASTIIATAEILSKGNYGIFPQLSWSEGVGLSLLSFAVIMGVSGLSIPLIAIGSLSVPLIANSIVEVSSILSKGSFKGGPSISWAIGTGSLLTTFGSAMILLGTYIGGTLGLGYLALKAGGKAINLVAQSIVDSGLILSRGIFNGGPSESWAKGVGLSISAFAPVYDELSKGGIIKWFTGSGAKPEDMANAIRVISHGIVDAAIFFNNTKVAFTGGPSKDWSEGVGGAISAFAPVIGYLHKGGVFEWFTGSLKPEDMKKAIVSISDAIVSAARIFSGTSLKDIFTGGPSKDWAEGIGGAISAFTPTLDFLYKGGVFGWFTGGLNPEDMKKAIVSISDAIASASQSFNTKGISFDKYPDDKWGIGVGNAISAFAPVIDKLNKGGVFSWFSGGVNPEDMKKAIVLISDAISQSSISLSTGNYTSIPGNYMTNLSTNVKEYVKLINYLKGSGTYEDKILGVTISKSSQISKMADDYTKLADSITKLSGSISSIDIDKITALKTFTGSIVLMSLMDTAQFDSMMNALESKAKVFVDVINDIDKEASAKGMSIRPVVQSKDSGPSLQDAINVLNKIDNKLSLISSSSDNISRYVNEIRTPKAQIKKNR